MDGETQGGFGLTPRVLEERGITLGRTLGRGCNSKVKVRKMCKQQGVGIGYNFICLFYTRNYIKKLKANCYLCLDGNH